MKFKLFSVALSAVALAASITIAAQNAELKTINIQGKEYYSYTIKKGDSVYGICKKFGWDESLLQQCNIGLDKKMNKGQTLYYPVSGKPIAQTEVSVPRKFRVDVNPQPVTHTVTRGETVYSIASLYGIPVDYIYDNNPGSRNGIRTGQTLTIIQPAKATNPNAPFYYSIAPGDNLSGLADKFNASVESIVRLNPGLNAKDLQTGQTIRIQPNTRPSKMVSSSDEINSVTAFTPYKVGKNDSWESIAQKSNLPVQDIKNANSSQTLSEKGEWIVVPQTERKVVTQITEVIDSTDNTPVAQQDIYQRVHKVNEKNKVDLAIVLENPSSKSNTDFLRGFLLGLDKMKHDGYKVNMHVIDASQAGINFASDSILNASNLIIGVYDNDFPEVLSNVGDRTGAEVVNVFDTKSNLYKTSPSTIQILQPLDYFNDLSASAIASNGAGRKLFLVGEIDGNDKLAEKLMEQFPSGDVARMPLEEFNAFPFNTVDRYIVYGYPSKKAEIEELLNAVAEKKEQGYDIITVGRPVWVAHMESLSDLYGRTGVMIPSRFFCNPKASENRGFNQKFNATYHRQPVNSFPQYAMMGYDIANYFIPTTAANGGDYNIGLIDRPGLQNDIDIKRLNTWSGFINETSYIIRCLPEGIVEKIEIK